uniref:Dirigent protein n=1 Tax=Aegilops tauschii subsp. strangulata TaxID=200361 RepID=A0A453QHH1_AEGTS
MATPTEEPTMETCGDDVSDPSMETIGVLSDVSMVNRSLPVGVVSPNFKVTRGFGGIAENAKVNVDRLYLRQILTGWDANQSDVIQPNAVTGLGKTAVNNWGVYDGAGSKAKLVAKTHGMHTLAGKWSNWFTLAFVVGRFEGSTLQVMGANDEDVADNDWAIVGGTGEFAMARGIIQRRVVPSPTKRGTVGGNRGTLPREMEGKSQRLENVTIYHVGAVEGFQFSYVDEDGKIRTTDTWGRVHPDPLRKTE